MIGTIPIIINNFNRYNSLKVLLNWIMNLDTPTSILIIDNNSSFLPLLQYYEALDQLPNTQVIHSTKNLGLKRILPVSMALRGFDKYIVSDADLVPYPDTPMDILEKMSQVLDENPEINHVGASLEIKDIPSYYPFQREVLQWEGKYWKNRSGKETFIAPVDTTFGMYRRSSLVTNISNSLRLDRPYTLKHVDWYVNPRNLTEEQRFYIDRCSCLSTWNTKLKNHLKPDCLFSDQSGGPKR